MIDDNAVHNTRVGFLLEGARRSRYDAEQWFRYLRKGIRHGEVIYSEEEIETILQSGVLSMFQTVTFKRAVQPGTLTNKRVAALNERTTEPMVHEILRRHGRI